MCSDLLDGYLVEQVMTKLYTLWAAHFVIAKTRFENLKHLIDLNPSDETSTLSFIQSQAMPNRKVVAAVHWIHRNFEIVIIYIQAGNHMINLFVATGHTNHAKSSHFTYS